MGKPTILIVDDEANIRSALIRWFEMREFEVFSHQFDVITLDLEMPRMGGLEALAGIRKTHPSTPVLVVTGFSKDVQRAVHAGALKVLTKPLRLRDLEDEVRGALALASG
mgnify:CR=1 FL=1